MKTKLTITGWSYAAKLFAMPETKKSTKKRRPPRFVYESDYVFACKLFDPERKVIHVYEKTHCWQYDKRLDTLEDDKRALGFSEDALENITVKDFSFALATKNEFAEIKAFINRYEWLGRMSLYPTHIYTARYKGILGGVIVFDMPTAFSKIIGEDTRKVEKLISRGACASWTPKCLASCLLMHGIRDMVKTTPFRLFVAYSDPEAKELGTIYQACNFYYLGKTSGTIKQYKLNDRWVSDRSFRSRSIYKRIAKSLGIVWQANWQRRDNILWEAMPAGIEDQIKAESKRLLKLADSREVPRKHKYAYILGKDKKETQTLKQQFFKNFDEKTVFIYPKERGN